MPESSDVSHDPPLRFSAATTDYHPSVVGPYRILGVLGTGGMAQTIEGLKAFEFALRRQFGVAEPGVLLGRSSDVPAEYRKQVEEYYRSLGRGARAKP